MKAKEFVQVAAALIERDGRYLITRRKQGVHLEGWWEFPGGKCRENESLEACVAREIVEEIGVKITNYHLFMTVQHEYPDRAVELHFFSCTIGKGEPRKLDCVDLCWVQPEDFPRYRFPPADEPVIARLLSESQVSEARVVKVGSSHPK